MPRGIQHIPTDALRQQVKAMSGFGNTQDEICVILGIKDPKCLRKHYKAELAVGLATANVNIGRSLYEQAVGRDAIYEGDKLIRPALLPDKSVSIFLGKARLGLRETSVHEHSGPGGGPIQTANYDLTALSTEELKTFRELLAKASKTRRAKG